MDLLTLVASVLFIAGATVATSPNEVDNNYLKCLVCRQIVTQMKDDLSKVDLKKMTDVGGFRLDAAGNEVKKSIPLRYSETYISDLLGDICQKKLKDYVRATYKDTGKLTLFSLLGPGGGLNPEISNVNVIQDEDLNQSVEHLCGDVISHEEDNLVDYLKQETPSKKDVCASQCEEIVERDEL